MLSTIEDPTGSCSPSLRILGDYHQRVRDFLGRLIQVAEQAGGNALSPAQRDALASALRYFQEEATRYKVEEETTFFPRLLQMDGAESKTVGAKLNALEDDHWLAHFEHDTLARIGRHWLDANHLTRSEFSVFCGALEELSRLYRRHFRMEAEEIFPLAGRMMA
jgi:iron-sulfur cluster repair protein YtfE (RIC family)